MAGIVGVVAFRLLYHLVLEESEVPAEKKQKNLSVLREFFNFFYLESSEVQECPPSQKNVN
jgi:hypothetical protein